MFHIVNTFIMYNTFMLIVTTINDFFKMQNLITQTVPVQRKPEQNHPPWMFNTGTDL